MANTQIRLHPGGKWHRPEFDSYGVACATACGKGVPGPYASRDWELDLELCDEGCFSVHERDTGELVVTLAAIEEQASTPLYDADDDPTDRIEVPIVITNERRKP